MARSVVIGGGLIGLLAAYQLHRRGEEVVLVDLRYPGEGCSSGNTGWIVPVLSGPIPAPGLTITSLKWMLRRESPLYIDPIALPKLAPWLWRFWRHCNESDYTSGRAAVAQLNLLTMTQFDDLAEQGLSFEMHRKGVLFVAFDEHHMQEFAADSAAISRYGFQPGEMLSTKEATELEPHLSPAIAGAVFVRDQRHVRPETLVESLVGYLRENGVEIRPKTAMTGATLDRRKNRVTRILTSNGQIEGDHFLISAGAWSGKLARMCGSEIPVQAGTGYSVTLPLSDLPLQYPLYLADAKVACSPFSDDCRLAGTMELSGIRENLNTRRCRSILKAAATFFPTWRQTSTAVTEWAGMRPMTPDGLPVIGRTLAAENVYIATAHAMLGVTLAPVTATAIAELMTTGTSDIDLSAFDPGRFAG